jgi:SAM-dependent methyltransferase
MTSTIGNCLTCDATDFLPKIELREMMFGFRDNFAYHQCKSCGTVQSCFDIGADLQKFYPPDYYSFSDASNQIGPLTRGLFKLRTRAIFNPMLGPIVAALKDDYQIRKFINWGGRQRDKILDVGCGSGHLLLRLESRGLTGMVGVDPYIARDIKTRETTIHKADLASINGTFDFIMFHHALEHIYDPHDAMNHVARLLGSDGRCVVRIPTVSSDAFDRYGKDWVQLDPPRHCFIPSREGMRILGDRSGLKLESVTDDSDWWVYFASEQYQQDVPLNSQVPPSNEGIKKYENQAEKANKSSRGDQAAFVFSKKI